MERQDALILFVGQLQDADLASWRQNGFHPLAVGFHLRWTTTEAKVHAELAHLEAHVQQAVAKLGSG